MVRAHGAVEEEVPVPEVRTEATKAGRVWGGSTGRLGASSEAAPGLPAMSWSSPPATFWPFSLIYCDEKHP